MTSIDASCYLVQFQLRFSPSLASKPTGPPKPKPVDAEAPGTSLTSNATQAFNPFENPHPSLLVTSLPPPEVHSQLSEKPSAGHNLVLNKFAVVPGHVILATTDFRPQTHLLEPADLSAAYHCIETYKAQEEDLFVFFNSGPHSGASQPHRHLQLLPVDGMRDGLEGPDSRWGVLAERLLDEKIARQLPFRTFVERINSLMTADELHAVYRTLYRQARASLDDQSSGTSHQPSNTSPPQEGSRDETDDEIHTLGEARISYNLAMTANVLAICPRLAEGAAIRSPAAGELGSVSLNGTVLAGTALVKRAEEWEALRAAPYLLEDALGRIGVPIQAS